MRVLALAAALALGGVREVGTIDAPVVFGYRVRIVATCDRETGNLIYIARDGNARIAMSVVKDGCPVTPPPDRRFCYNKVGAMIPCPEAPRQ